jgi:hypothetical protein
MFRLHKILLFFALVAGVILFLQKIHQVPSIQKHVANYPINISLKGVSIDDIEYDSCLRAIKCIKQYDLNGFNRFYIRVNQNSLTNAVATLQLQECAKWFNGKGVNTDAKMVHIDSVYGYTDENGSIIPYTIAGNDKERITYVTFLFPSNQTSEHSAKLLTFEFSDKISIDHFINWWSETI